MVRFGTRSWMKGDKTALRKLASRAVTQFAEIGDLLFSYGPQHKGTSGGKNLDGFKFRVWNVQDQYLQTLRGSLSGVSRPICTGKY